LRKESDWHMSYGTHSLAAGSKVLSNNKSQTKGDLRSGNEGLKL